MIVLLLSLASLLYLSSLDAEACPNVSGFGGSAPVRATRTAEAVDTFGWMDGFTSDDSLFDD